MPASRSRCRCRTARITHAIRRTGLAQSLSDEKAQLGALEERRLTLQEKQVATRGAHKDLGKTVELMKEVAEQMAAHKKAAKAVKAKHAEIRVKTAEVRKAAPHARAPAPPA